MLSRAPQKLQVWPEETLWRTLQNLLEVVKDKVNACYVSSTLHPDAHFKSSTTNPVDLTRTLGTETHLSGDSEVLTEVPPCAV